MRSDGSFQPVPIFNDTALARLFAHEVLALLVSKDLIRPEMEEKILSWRHTGFNVHRQVMIRYYGLYSNAHRGVMKKRGEATSALPILEPPAPREASASWRELIRKVYEVDPLAYPACGARGWPNASESGPTSGSRAGRTP